MMTGGIKCQPRDCGSHNAPEPDPVKFLSLSLEIPWHTTTLHARLTSFFAIQERQWQCVECK